MQVYAYVSNQQKRNGIGLGVLLSQSVGEMEIKQIYRGSIKILWGRNVPKDGEGY